MSAHGKENGKGAEAGWVGLSCDADGRMEERGTRTVGEGNPSATVLCGVGVVAPWVRGSAPGTQGNVAFPRHRRVVMCSRQWI